jgi:hypothetical protein
VKQIQPELNRLTTLQRQILKWIRLEGGGCLPVDRLFTSLYQTHSQTHKDVDSLSERTGEAIEQLARSGYVEIRSDLLAKSKFPSLYDLGGILRNLNEVGDTWVWKSGSPPEIALTDFGSHYAARMT